MKQATNQSGLESILERARVLFERARDLTTAVIPLIRKTEEDIRYLEGLVTQDPRFGAYRGTIQLREYLTDVLKQHENVVRYNKLADTLDKALILVPAELEELVEIPLKIALYITQWRQLAGDKRLSIPRGRLLGMGMKYGIFEAMSAIPGFGGTVGELFDLTNVYCNEYMRAIASGIRFENFQKHASSKQVIDLGYKSR